MRVGGKFTPLPVRFFLITFFSLKLRAWNFLTLSFYPLDTMWQNFIKKYWLAEKLWHFCHQWLAKSARYKVWLVNLLFILLPDFQIIWNNSVTFCLFEPIDLSLLIITWWGHLVREKPVVSEIMVQYLKN